MVSGPSSSDHSADTTKREWLSRSALADQLGHPLKDITQAMIDAGWIRQEQGDRWVLTAKGEFEGGVYRKSKRFGEYVAWPLKILDHPVFLPFLEPPLLTLAQFSKQADLPSAMVVASLSDLGWIESVRQGFIPTAEGSQQGIQARQNDKTGVPYLMFEDIVAKSAHWLAYLERLNNPPLFEQGKRYVSLQGSMHTTVELARIASWLYMRGVVFSTCRPVVFTRPDQKADFYLPVAKLFIDMNYEGIAAADLARLIARQQVYQQHHLPFIELVGAEWPYIENTLPKALLQHDVIV